MNLIIKKTMGYRSGHPNALEDIDPETTRIGEIKQKIHSLTGIEARFQKLLCMGRVLEPDSAIISRFLRQQTSTVHLSPNGLEAIEAFRQSPYASLPLSKLPPTLCLKPEIIVSIHTLSSRRYQWKVGPLTTVREMKLRLRDTDGHPLDGPHAIDFVCHGVCLREDNFTMSDYNVDHGSRLHIVLRLHRRGLPWSVAHERRLTRILEPFNKGQAPASLYPHALECLSTGSSGQTNVFAALCETLPLILGGVSVRNVASPWNELKRVCDNNLSTAGKSKKHSREDK